MSSTIYSFVFILSGFSISFIFYSVKDKIYIKLLILLTFSASIVLSSLLRDLMSRSAIEYFVMISSSIVSTHLLLWGLFFALIYRKIYNKKSQPEIIASVFGAVIALVVLYELTISFNKVLGSDFFLLRNFGINTWNILKQTGIILGLGVTIAVHNSISYAYPWLYAIIYSLLFSTLVSLQYNGGSLFFIYIESLKQFCFVLISSYIIYYSFYKKDNISYKALWIGLACILPPTLDFLIHISVSLL